MKLRRLLCCLALCAALLPAKALADVIWEPEDRFFASVQEECEYLPRNYTANGEGGELVIWKTPGSLVKKGTVPNGETIFCAWLYTDREGETWGGVEYTDSGDFGWFRLAETVAVKDSITFEEEHGEEFIPFDQDTLGGALDGVETVVLWTYPGSGAVVAEGIDAQWFTEDGKALSDSLQTCYQDREGRIWAYVGYCYGICNTWLCLSAPSDATLPAEPNGEAEPVDQTPTASSSADSDPGEVWTPQEADLPVIVLVLVAAVMAGTAMLIPLVVKRPKGEKDGSQDPDEEEDREGEKEE